MADYTQTQLDALRSAYASGETKVTTGDTTIEYGTARELERKIKVVENALNLANTGNTRVRQVRIRTSKGL